MGKYIAVLFGLIAMAGGLILILFVWGGLVLKLLYACLPLVLLFGGLIAFMAGISSLKDAARAQRLEEETEDIVNSESEIE